MANNSRANHVRQKFIFLAVPHEHNRTRTSTAVDFGDHIPLILAGRIHFVLQHPGGPQQPNHVRSAPVPKARHDFGWPLSQVAGSAGDLPFLLQRASGELQPSFRYLFCCRVLPQIPARSQLL